MEESPRLDRLVYVWHRRTTGKGCFPLNPVATYLLLNVSVEQRSLCIDVLFEVLKATKAETLSEINENKFSNIITMIKTYKNLDEENKEIVTKVLNVLLKIGRSNIGKKE